MIKDQADLEFTQIMQYDSGQWTNFPIPRLEDPDTMEVCYATCPWSPEEFMEYWHPVKYWRIKDGLGEHKTVMLQADDRRFPCIWLVWTLDGSPCNVGWLLETEKEEEEME